MPPESDTEGHRLRRPAVTPALPMLTMGRQTEGTLASPILCTRIGEGLGSSSAGPPTGLVPRLGLQGGWQAGSGERALASEGPSRRPPSPRLASLTLSTTTGWLAMMS